MAPDGHVALAPLTSDGESTHIVGVPASTCGPVVKSLVAGGWVFAAVLVAACGSPLPVSTQIVAPSPAPAIVCEPAYLPGDLPEPPFSCEDAARVAIAGLPADHRPIDRVVVFFGSYCPTGSLCGIQVTPVHDGYVVFDVADPFFDLWATVHADDVGSVTLTGDVVTYPGGRYPWRPR